MKPDLVRIAHDTSRLALEALQKSVDHRGYSSEERDEIGRIQARVLYELAESCHPGDVRRFVSDMQATLEHPNYRYGGDATK